MPCDILFVRISSAERSSIGGRAAEKEQAAVYTRAPLERVYLMRGGNQYRYESITRDLPVNGFVLRSVSIVAAKKFFAITFTRVRIVL